MPKIIDSFLFFQEVDLLEIRLKYLDPYVDFFVIVEACQTFTGKPKEFVFEKNFERFSEYKEKIFYYKIEDFHADYESIIKFLESQREVSFSKIKDILESHTHYSKKHIHWVLDSYHRECLHIALEKVAKEDDIVLISDLDEIPSVETFSDKQKKNEYQTPYVYQQNEFRYFLNYYKDSDWLGSISGRYSLLKEHSYNLLRIDSKEARELVAKESIKHGGYHFTSCGGVEMIKKKIESWGHQEFNNNLILDNLEKNIQQGRDIFMRDNETNLKSISISDRLYFDQHMADIISKYPKLISTTKIEQVKESFLSKIKLRLLINAQKIFYKIRLRIK